MNDLTVKETLQNIQDEIFISPEGQGYCTIRGAARICGVPESTLRSHFSDARKNSSKLAKKLAGYGFEVRDFSSTGISDMALSIIVKHYSFKSEIAEKADYAFSSIGVRNWMQQLKGWSSRSTETDKLIRLEELRLKNQELDINKINALHGLSLAVGKEYAIALTTGKMPVLPPATKPEVEQLLVTKEGKVIGATAKNFSLSSFIKALNVPTSGKGSGKVKTHVKELLKDYGIDLDTGVGCQQASYTNIHNVIPECQFEGAINYVAERLRQEHSSSPTLFEHNYFQNSGKL